MSFDLLFVKKLSLIVVKSNRYDDQNLTTLPNHDGDCDINVAYLMAENVEMRYGIHPAKVRPV